MSDYAWPNMAAMFFEQTEHHRDKPLLWAKRDGTYQPQTWQEISDRVDALAKGLMKLGIEPGDRVVLVSENRPAWTVADLAIMALGAYTVPAYVTNTLADHLHILEDSGAKGAIVSTAKLARNLLPAAAQASTVEFVIAMERPETVPHQGVEVHDFDELVDSERSQPENIAERARRWATDDTACIIYTSGTGGQPKGVMLSHRNLFHNVAGARDALEELGLGNEVFLSFLPLSHSYEHMAGHFFPLSIGAEIYYAEGIETFAKNMLETRPTIMTAVPRLYETLHQRITHGVKMAGGLKEKMFSRAVELGEKRLETGRLGAFEGLQDVALDKLVRDKVRGRFGGRLKALVSGGAPLNPEIARFFTALSLRILQGYGQTETAPLVSVNRPSAPKLHTVGPPVLNTEVKIAEDGEILARGDMVMQGYWRNEEATRAVVRDGWVHTGDVGYLDEGGHLVITDRKKDIIVNSGGDNIAPQRVEGILAMEPEVAQAMVYGDKRPHLVALVVPDGDWLKDWTRDGGKTDDLSVLADDADFQRALRHVLDRVNDKLSTIEKVRHVLLADEPFSVENGQMTPTMKVRRHVIKEVYGERLEALYG